jgi:hypothetical protein
MARKTTIDSISIVGLRLPSYTEKEMKKNGQMIATKTNTCQGTNAPGLISDQNKNVCMSSASNAAFNRGDKGPISARKTAAMASITSVPTKSIVNNPMVRRELKRVSMLSPRIYLFGV